MVYVLTFSIIIDKRTKQYYLLSTNTYVLIGITLNGSVENFAFRIPFMCRFSNVYNVPFHWFILLFLDCPYLRWQKWQMFFYGFIIYIYLRCLRLSKYWFILKIIYILLKVLLPYISKRERVSGNLFWKTFSFNFFDKKVFLARTKYVC